MEPNEVFAVLRQSIDKTLKYKLTSGDSIYDSIAYSSLEMPSRDFSAFYTPSYLEYNIAITHLIEII